MRDADDSGAQPHPSTLVLFSYDWDAAAYAALQRRWPSVHMGFDLFSFPSNTRLAWFDMERFVRRCIAQARRAGLKAVASNHEQFGALAAALVAERMGWPGTPVDAVLACQHKLYAREVLARACPDASIPFGRLEAIYGGPVPDDLVYPLFIKPVKAAFSVLARTIHNREELHEHTRFGGWELWVIKHLVEPFERIARRRLPQAGTSHSLMWEAPIDGPQYCLDGYVHDGRLEVLGCVDIAMYPGTQAFRRFDFPSRLPVTVQARAGDIAKRFLEAVGFTHGFFNMEFFHDPATDALRVIEFNPRLASQFSDLYRRVLGLDLHEMTLALAHGLDPATVPRLLSTAGAAASFVYREFDPVKPVVMPTDAQRSAFQQAFPDALLLEFPKSAGSTARDHKWLGSHRYGIVHLGGLDLPDLERRCVAASAVLDWPAPCVAADPMDLPGHVHVEATPVAPWNIPPDGRPASNQSTWETHA